MKKNQHGCCGINSVEVGRIHRDGNKCLNQGHNGRDEVSWAFHLSTVKVDLLMITSRTQGRKAKNDFQSQ